MSKEKYFIRVVTKYSAGAESAGPFYHATVTRRCDGTELLWVDQWRWLLDWKIKPKRIDRAFKRYDKRQERLARKEEYTL